MKRKRNRSSNLRLEIFCVLLSDSTTAEKPHLGISTDGQSSQISNSSSNSCQKSNCAMRARFNSKNCSGFWGSIGMRTLNLYLMATRQEKRCIEPRLFHAWQEHLCDTCLDGLQPKHRGGLSFQAPTNQFYNQH